MQLICDQGFCKFCFRYIDSTITLLLKSEIPSLKSSSVCLTWLETQKKDRFSHDAAQMLMSVAVFQIFNTEDRYSCEEAQA